MKVTQVVASASVFFIAIVVSLLSLVTFNGTSEPVEGSSAVKNILSTLCMQLFNFFSINNVAMDAISPALTGATARTEVDAGGNDPIVGRNFASVAADASKQTCRSFFPLKCEMYPYVQYWNKILHKEDCYQSPLKHPLGDKAPPEEQKYVVFQPDRGGWNNIRMAAEVVIIFAHATGRYSNQ